MTRISRRDFLAAAALTAGCSSVPELCGAERPLATVGLITDTHIGNDRASCEKVRQAWELFRSLRVDLVANLGDVADHNYPKGYEGYRATVDAVRSAVPDWKPREVYAWAWHDFYDFGGDGDRACPRWQEAIADASRRIGATHAPFASFELGGCPFVVAPQWGWEDGKLKAMLDDAVAGHPGKPVFLLFHVPPTDTVYNTKIWGYASLRKLLDDYPQVIQLSGHVHGSLRNELNIWQGNFTVVNAGCLSSWGGSLIGTDPVRRPGNGAIAMEIYGDRIVFRRYDIRRGNEICTDNPWTVPWPFDAKTAPYNPTNRARRFPAPQFAAGARLSVRSVGTPPEAFELSFPQALREGSFEYKIEVARREADGSWRTFKRQDIFSGFSYEDYDPELRQPVRHVFPSVYFEEGERLRFTVTPFGFFGACGRPLVAEATVPVLAKTGTLVWESGDPMRECPFRKGLAGGAGLRRDGEWYVHDAGEARLEFPEGVWKGPAKTKFRFTVDLRMRQDSGREWTLVLRNPKPLRNANGRIATPPGDSGLQRYVIEFEKANANDFYYFLVREGGAGLIRFEHMRIERL